MDSKNELVRGRVSFSAQEEYRVLVGGAGTELTANALRAFQEINAEPSGKVRAFGELPAVGDTVLMRVVGDLGLIEEVEPRKTAFVRKAVGRAGEGQVVAANVDVVFVVCGLDGDFSLRRIERYLVLAWESGARPVIVLNKADVCEDVAAVVANVKAIAGDADVVATSASLNDVEPLRAWLREGMTAVLLGSSGAGKSTIANALGAGDLATQEVRAHDSRGRHTTTSRMLVALPGGAFLMDTPGMRELGVLAGDGALALGFTEIAEFAQRCRFGNCGHAGEPGCAVREAVEAGAIDAERWASFVKLQKEARHNAVAADATAQAAEKQKWKAIHKAAKKMYRERGR